MRVGAFATFRGNGARGLAIAALTLFAFVIHAMIPQGWMPVAGASGDVTLVICSVHGAQTIDLKNGPAPVQQKKSTDQICSFAGAGGHVLAPSQAPSLPVPLTAPAQKLFALNAIPYGAWRLTLYSSRAPPALV